MSHANSDNSRDLEIRFEELVAAYDEALMDGSSIPAFDDSTAPAKIVPRLRGLAGTLDLLAEGRRSGELAEILAACRRRSDGGDADNEVPFCDKIGAFDIHRELGRGGYGLVFLAYDSRLDRPVALKVPRPEALVTPELRRRFLREAQAAGGLDHPNLVAVYEVGEDGPLCYIASSYCDGPTLSAWLAARRESVPCREAASTIAALADGVDYAHRHSVLHRDIKPSNVLLDPRPGESSTDNCQPASLSAFTPRLTDFGLAKLLERDDGETRSGMLLGTPAYMAPEQANGRVRDVCAATDVYGLGVLLYELLTGLPPFRGASDPDTLRQVCADEPVPPSRRRPNVPRDLEAICLKCLAKTPESRYDSAADLARDLRRYLAGDPTIARPTKKVEKTIKWVRRHPAVAALLGTVLLASTLLASGGWWYSQRLAGALGQVQSALDEARAREQESRSFLYTASVNLAARAMESDNIQEARTQLERAVPAPGQSDLREFAWRFLWGQLNEERLQLSGHTADVYCVRYSPAGNVLGTASKDGTARLWDRWTGECLHVLEGHGGEVNCVAFSATGTSLASASDDGQVRIWDVSTGAFLHSFQANEASVLGVDFSPEGTRLATCGRNNSVVIWDVSTWQQIALMEGHTADVESVAFSPQGNQLITASDDGTARIWDVETSECTAVLNGHHLLERASSISSAVFSLDEKQVLTAGREDRSVCLWDVSTVPTSKELGRYYGWVRAALFCDNDRKVAVATKDGSLELIDVNSAKAVRKLRGHPAGVNCLAASLDGSELASASADGTVKIWEVNESRSRKAVQYDAGSGMGSIAISNDGRTCVAAGGKAGVQVWDVQNRTLRRQAGPDFEITGDFNGDKIWDAGYYQDGIWHLRMSVSTLGSAQQFTDKTFRFGEIGAIPITGDWDNNGCDDLGYYRPADGWWFFDLDGIGGNAERSAQGFRGAIPMSGRWLPGLSETVGDEPGEARFTGEGWHFNLFRCDNNNYHTNVKHGTDRSVPTHVKQAAGTGDEIGLLDGDELRIDITKSGGLPEWVVDHVGQAPPRYIRSCGSPEWDCIEPEADIHLPSLDAARDRAQAVLGLRRSILAIAPQGDFFAYAREVDPRVKLWDLQSGQQLAVLRLPSPNIDSLAFAPQGRKLAVATNDGRVTFFDCATLEKLEHIAAHDPGVTNLAYAPNGELLATTGEEGTIKLWNTKQVNQVRMMRDEQRYDIRSVTFSPNGDLIAVAGNNRIVNLWDTATGNRVGRLAGHSGSVNAVAFSPDGRTLASSSSDGTIRLWDVVTKQELLTSRDKLGGGPIGFGAAGNQLLTLACSDDGESSLHFWSAANWESSSSDAAIVGDRKTVSPRAAKASAIEHMLTRARLIASDARSAEAEVLYRDALELSEELRKRDAVSGTSLWSRTCVDVGTYLAIRKKVAEAADAYRQVIDRGTPEEMVLHAEQRLFALTHPTSWAVDFYGWEEQGRERPPTDWDAVLDSPVLAEKHVEFLNFDWDLAKPAEDVPDDHFSLIATTQLDLSAGMYSLHTLADDGVRVFIDGRSVLENWARQPVASTRANVELTKGLHEIRVEYMEITGHAVLKLSLLPVASATAE